MPTQHVDASRRCARAGQRQDRQRRRRRSASSATATRSRPAASSASASPKRSRWRWRTLYLAKQADRTSDKPRNLTLVYAAGQGDGKERGLNHLGHEGLRAARDRRALGPGAEAAAARHRQPDRGLQPAARRHLASVPRHRRRAARATSPASASAPSSIRATAAARSTSCTTEDLVRADRASTARNTCSTSAFPINVGIIRGTTADPDGNITMEKEALTLEVLAIAMAARNSGGVVIVQVERIAERGIAQSARRSRFPASWSTASSWREAGASLADLRDAVRPGVQRRDPGADAARSPPMEMSERKIIARRAALELDANSVVNLGIGMPEGVANVANEEKIARPDDADGRAGRDRRRAGGRAQLRRRDQRAGRDRPALPVRLLRRRRPRRGVPRPGAGRPRRAISTSASSARGSRAPAASSTSARTPRRSCSSAPSPRAAADRDRGRTAAHRQRRASAASSSREVEHRTFSGAYAATARAAGALRHRTLRVRLDRGRARADRGRARHRHRARHPGADGVPADHPRRDPASMDPRIFATEPMGLRDDLLRMPLEQRFTYHPQREPVLRQLRRARGAQQPGRRADPPHGRDDARAARAQGLRHRQLRQLPDLPGHRRRLHRHGERSGRIASIPASPATPPTASCAPSSATR